MEAQWARRKPPRLRDYDYSRNGMYFVTTNVYEGQCLLSRPTLMQVVGTFKSVTACLCNQIRNTPGKKFWQDSFYESLLRNDKAYQNAWNYIDANPAKWAEDKYYVP